MEPAKPRYCIGIDLGTTNSALAYTEFADSIGPVHLAPIPQLLSANEVGAEPLLPSFLYIPVECDFPVGSTALPWNPAPQYVVGKLAQKRGAEVSSRLVSSAKSWLSYSAVDRTAAMLPWKAAEGLTRISPLDASAEYLKHLRAAWDQEHPEAPFDQQEVLVTVPASYDAIARDLTQRAAESAGYRNLTMLEEPQAAFYAWLERHPDWRQRVGKGDLVLVIDIGGGTTDFTLIAVTEQNGELQLDRVAVGEHILLGGDNIDLALAHTLAGELAAKGMKIDGFQLRALWNNCRLAKVKLLDANSKADETPVTILGKGSSLIGGTIKAKLRREQIEQVLEGFLPRVESTDMPHATRRIGLQEMGLPYASDPAITRHLAKFLRQQASAAEHSSVRRGASGLACPTHVLFNGGVLHAQFVADRLLEVLSDWLATEGFGPVKALAGEDLMHSVARGSAYYGAARHGRRANSRRHRAFVLRGHRIFRARRTGLPCPGPSSGGRAIRYGRRHGDANSRSRIRSDRERTCRVPFLLFGCAQERFARRPDRRFWRRSRRVVSVEVRLTSDNPNSDLVPCIV